MSGGGLQLPTELHEEIMCWLADDPPTLRACALVCRAWTAASRKILYHDTTIETETQFHAFEKASESSPYIQECVHILRIDRSRRTHELNYSWINNKLSPVLPKQLKRLHTLALIKVDEKWKKGTFEKLSLFGSVTKLSLVSCSMSPDELYGLLGAFPSLIDVYLEHFIELFHDRLRMFGHSPRTPSQTSSPSSIKLTHLTLFSEDLPRSRELDFFQWIQSTYTKDTLRSLRIAIGKQDISKRGSFLRELGEKLEHLELRFVRRFGRSIEDKHHIIGNIDLSVNAGLKSITLPDPAHLAVFPLLSQLVAPDLRRIIFRIRIFRLEDVDGIDHTELIRILLQSNLRSVHEVRFLYFGHFPYEDVFARFTLAYPSWKENSLLRIERDYDRQVTL